MQSTYVEAESDDVCGKEAKCKRGEMLRDTDLLPLEHLILGLLKKGNEDCDQ
jgi:hypothetical protein